MIDHAPWTTARGRPVGRGIDVAGRRVDVAFAGVPAGGACSAAAARLAEDLVAARLGCDRRLVRVAALMPSGRPLATVQGRQPSVRVSLSHDGGLVGAAVCATCGVGLDIVAAADAGPALDGWFTADELAILRDDDDRPRARLWAAKEAAFKAAGLDEGFRPLAVAIARCGSAGFRWSVRGDHRRVSGRGLFGAVGGQAMAVAVAAEPTDLHHPSRSA